jgi:N6-L-threonylcarbamoyladenine synthase
MRILAVETSCDETAIAVLEIKNRRNPDFKLLSNIVSSQVKIHQKYGGVFPALAKREHQNNLIPVLKKALVEANLLKPRKREKQLKTKTLEKILQRENKLFPLVRDFLAKYQKPRIDFLAVTMGPGLEPCLWTGINLVKALAFKWNLRIIPVNHIEAHIYANLFQNQKTKFKLPILSLIVSGGHSQLILIRKMGSYQIVGETRDDAAGECFDKTARILGLPYPGGPQISIQAEKYKKEKYGIKLPKPMFFSKDYDLSFSGLKTAVLYDFKTRKVSTRNSPQYIQEMAAKIQSSIVDVLVKKTIKAAKDFRAQTIILGGGVAANKQLREKLKQKIEQELSDVNYLQPQISFCTDNAAMIALTAFYHLSQAKNWKKIKANANLRVE